YLRGGRASWIRTETGHGSGSKDAHEDSFIFDFYLLEREVCHRASWMVIPWVLAAGTLDQGTESSGSNHRLPPHTPPHPLPPPAPKRDVTVGPHEIPSRVVDAQPPERLAVHIDEHAPRLVPREACGRDHAPKLLLKVSQALRILCVDRTTKQQLQLWTGELLLQVGDAVPALDAHIGQTVATLRAAMQPGLALTHD